MAVEVPDNATIVRYGESYNDPPVVDAAAATLRALREPLGSPPLRELVGPGSRIAIGFPDRVKGGSHRQSHRRTALPIILEELASAGVRDTDINLVCAVGLHRKNTRSEMEEYLPQELFDRFWPDRLVNHDAEDPDGILRLGTDDWGNELAFNRKCAEADICILLGHTQGNPYGGFSGGYKMPVTGLTTWRSIRGHHTPGSMYRTDFLPVTPRSHFRHQLRAIGTAIERKLAKRFFLVDAVVGTTAGVLGVFAGTADEVERASWDLAARRTDVQLETAPSDVLVFGMPRTFHYGPGMGTNPLLVLQAIGATLSRVHGAMKRNPVVIAASVCDGWFNDEWFPAYREIHQRWQTVANPDEMVPFEEEISTRPEYVEAYRFGNAYHPFHGFSMLYMGGLALRETSAILVPGAQMPGMARSMGMIPTRTFADALHEAERFVGANARLLVLPEYLTKVPAHLFAAN
jgi:hypothetical protein